MAESGATTMRDVFDFDSPSGWPGRYADVLFLQAYMLRLWQRRAHVIWMAAEAGVR